MSKVPAKKSMDRRRKPRSARVKADASPAKRRAVPAAHMAPRGSSSAARAVRGSMKRRDAEIEQELCKNCGKALDGKGRALFVEEEVGRVFCSEPCIAGFFTPEIARLEKEYFRRLPANDLSGDERERFAHLRWVTLQEPDEIWREKTLAGDYRYSLISEFQPGSERVWCVCICLFLRGEPSFLYLAFPTRSEAMATHYRKGERVQWERARAGMPVGSAARGSEAGQDGGEDVDEQKLDRLADAWTADETFLARLGQERSLNDIPSEDFGLYQSCLEETLQEPDEVWSVKPGGEDGLTLYHFIRNYPDESPGVWYLIVARETEDEEQIEILDAFPTKDAGLVERYRTGEQEVGSTSSRPATQRVVH